MNLELKEDLQVTDAIEMQTVSLVPTITDITFTTTNFSELNLKNAMNLNQLNNNESMQSVATGALSVNISESESEFKPDDDFMNFTDSDHESQFSEHNDDEKPESHSDQNSVMTSEHFSSNIASS